MKSSTVPLRLASAQWAVAAILAAALVLRCIGVTSQWLWLDELLAVNWTVHGPWVALVNILRFDLHPPLYYLQLSLWALVSHDDVWLMANSIFWSTAAIGLLIGWRLHWVAFVAGWATSERSVLVVRFGR